MAKNATNAGKKYIIEWNGKRNNWGYKLVIIPSYNDSNYASLTDTTENYSCLLDYEYIPFEFDKYYLGLSAAPSLKLDFDLTRCSTDLANVLCDPFTTFNRVTAFNTDDTFPCHELFTSGNVFEFYINFNIDESSDYVLQYRGTQITSIEQYDNENKILSIETESITKTIMGQIKFDNFLFLHCFYTQNSFSEAVPSTTLTTANIRVIDVKNTTDGFIDNKTIIQAGGAYSFYFDNYEKFHDGIEKLCSLLYKKIMRKSSYETFTITPIWNSFFRCDNTVASASRGTEIAFSDLKIIAHIGFSALTTQIDFNEIGSTDGIVYGLGNEYESVYDFFSDLIGSYCNKGIALNQNLYVGQLLNATNKTVNTKELHDVKISFFSDVSSKFTISSSEDHEGKTDSVETNIIGTRSSEAIEFQQPLHNVPLVGEKTNFSIESFDTVSGVGQFIYYLNKIPNLCVWYFTSGTTFLPVHPRNKIDLGDTNNSDTYNTVSATLGVSPYNYDYGVNNPNNFDNKYGSYYVASETISYFFSDNYQTKIECSVFAEYLQDTFLTDYSPFLLPTLNYFTVDLSSLEPATGVFSEIPTKYEITSSKLTKENEMCEITLLSRRI